MHRGPGIECLGCGPTAVMDRIEHTAQGYRGLCCRDWSKTLVTLLPLRRRCDCLLP
jgi:hypothetical protein